MNGPGHSSHLRSTHTHRDAWPPTPVAEPTSLAPQQERPKGSRGSQQSAGRPGKGKVCVRRGQGGGQGLHGRSAPAPFPGRAPPPAAGRVRLRQTQSEGRRERARGLALSGPTSACPACPRARVRRSGPQGRGRERRAGCTSLRASQAARTPA